MTLFVLGKFGQMCVSEADTQSLQLHRGVLPVPCVLWTVYLNLCHHQQSPSPARQHIDGNPKPFRESKPVLRTAQEPV